MIKYKYKKSNRKVYNYLGCKFLYKDHCHCISLLDTNIKSHTQAQYMNTALRVYENICAIHKRKNNLRQKTNAQLWRTI